MALGVTSVWLINMEKPNARVLKEKCFPRMTGELANVSLLNPIPSLIHPNASWINIDVFAADPCYKSHCEFCIIDKHESAQCTCPEGKVLDTDKKYCISNLNKTTSAIDLQRVLLPAEHKNDFPVTGDPCKQRNCDDVCEVIGGRAMCGCKKGRILKKNNRTCKRKSLTTWCCTGAYSIVWELLLL